jgi:multidrug efflux pump subunit AcrB
LTSLPAQRRSGSPATALRISAATRCAARDTQPAAAPPALLSVPPPPYQLRLRCAPAAFFADATPATFLASGADPEELNDSEEGKHSGKILVTLRASADRATQETAVRAQIEQIVREEPAVQELRFSTSSVLQFRASVIVEVLGHDLELLRQACEKVAGAMQSLPQLRDVRSTLQRGNPELTVRFDREQLAAQNLDPGAITALLRQKVQGDVPTQFAERERKLDIRVRMDKQELASEAALRELNVNPLGVPEIPLRSVAEIVRREGPSEIRRFGNVRGAEVSATMSGFDLARTQLEVEAALASIEMPRGTEARIGGQKEELERSQSSLTLRPAQR